MKRRSFLSYFSKTRHLTSRKDRVNFSQCFLLLFPSRVSEYVGRPTTTSIITNPPHTNPPTQLSPKKKKGFLLLLPQVSFNNFPQRRREGGLKKTLVIYIHNLSLWLCRSVREKWEERECPFSSFSFLRRLGEYKREEEGVKVFEKPRWRLECIWRAR